MNFLDLWKDIALYLYKNSNTFIENYWLNVDAKKNRFWLFYIQYSFILKWAAGKKHVRHCMLFLFMVVR